MLKQLGREVQEAEVKMKQLEKAVKWLQWELEVEVGEHGSTEELVLELREVGEEVQVVDSLWRERWSSWRRSSLSSGQGEVGRSRGQEPGGGEEEGEGYVQEDVVRQGEPYKLPPRETAGLRAEPSLLQKGDLRTAGPVDWLWTKRITDNPRQQWFRTDECIELCTIRQDAAVSRR